MKSEKERLQELDKEPFYFKFFSGTKMPTCPSYIQIVMFNDMFSVETEEGRKENINDIGIIKLVKASCLLSLARSICALPYS